MSTRIVIKYDNFAKIAKKLSKETEEIVRKAAQEVEAYEKSVVPVDTGNLANSIQMEMTSPASAIVSAGGEVAGGDRVEYAEAVEYGTRAHVIQATNKAALYWPGARHPVRKVNHPGTKARPYMRPAAEKVGPSFIEACKYRGLQAAGGEVEMKSLTG